MNSKNVLLTYFCLIERDPGKGYVGEELLDDVRGADHLNMDIQMEEANLHLGDVQEPLVNPVISPDHDLNSVDMLAHKQPSATGQEPHNYVHVSTEIDVQQEASKQSYSNIFITALHLNKLKKNFWDRGRERT